MRTILVALTLWTLAIPSQACIWVKGTTKEGKVISTSGLGPAKRISMQLKQSLETNLQEEGAAMEEALRNAKTFDERNDYAVALIYLGRSKEAIEWLQKLEIERPGDYATAANLGTAYELAGDNQKALYWIKEGIRRNPNSHEGTEWLHIKILEAKIYQEKDPDYFKNHSVLNLDQKSLDGAKASVWMDGKGWKKADVAKALQYQLIERTKFVKKSDPAVASLFFDYAALEWATGTVESAKDLLGLAMEFGYPASKAQPVMKRYDRTIKLASIGMKLRYAGYALLGVGFVAYAAKRKWIVCSRPRKTPSE